MELARSSPPIHRLCSLAPTRPRAMIDALKYSGSFHLEFTEYQFGIPARKPVWLDSCPETARSGFAKQVRQYYPIGQVSVCDAYRVNRSVGQRVPFTEVGYFYPADCDGGKAVGQASVGGNAVQSNLRHVWWRRVTRALLGAIALFAWVETILGGHSDARGLTSALQLRLIAVSIAIVVSAILLHIGRLAKADPPNNHPMGPEIPDSPTIADIALAVQQASRKYKNEVLYLFQRILQEPTRYMTRINEKVEAREGCLCLDVVVDYAFNDATTEMVHRAGERTILLPLIKPKKRVMLDNLEITNDDKHVPALLQEEVNGLIVSVINNLFRLAFLSHTPNDIGRKLTDAEERLRWSLINLACHVDCVDPATKNAILSLLDFSALSVVDSESLKSLRDFCDFCADHYFIVVEVELPAGSRLSMKYTRTVPEYGRTADWNDRLRVRLGLSPYRYSIPLRLPFDAPSYHFSMLGVSGQYLLREALIDTRTGEQIEPTVFSHMSPRPSLQGRHGSGLPYAHIYTRGLDKAPVIDMSTRVEFAEIPPGALGGAFVVSTACAILIWFFAVVQPGLRPADHLASSDLPALLLAVPAFAATWIGQSVDRILRSSLSAYVGLSISAVLSMASALLYVANSNGISFLPVRNATFFGGLVGAKDIDMTWFCLAFAASVVTAYLAEMLREQGP